MSFVYFATAGAFVKIGLSKHPLARIEKLRVCAKRCWK